jgi:GH35 family endo-1,4-beta-xylanase
LDKEIQKHRTGLFRIHTKPGAAVHVEQERHEFWFGAALATQAFRDWMKPEDSAKYKAIFLTNFNAAVTENALKWHDMEGEQGKVNYQVVDAMLAWTDEHHIPLRGHNIFWGIENRVQPWLKSMDDAKLRETLKARALDVGRRYKGRFAEYDLNNEMLHGNYYAQRLGEGITKEMASWVREGDPQAMLYLNDYDILTGRRLDDYVGHIRTFLDEGVPFRGIGVQGHLHGDTFDPAALKHALDSLARFKLPIRVTEFNFPGQRSKYYGQRDAQSIRRRRIGQGEGHYRLLQDLLRHPAVEGILMWGFWEGRTGFQFRRSNRRDGQPRLRRRPIATWCFVNGGRARMFEQTRRAGAR